MVAWEGWGIEAFARAARERRPVLLSITAPWCRACHEMERTTYADTRVADLIHRHFVPVRVDTDRRPDINDRYNLGGWPTTAFLTPDGRVITGGTYISLDRMPSVLSRVAEAFTARAGDWPAATDYTDYTDYTEDTEDTKDTKDTKDTDHTDHAESYEHSGDELMEEIFSAFDEEHGGFGIEPKFPLAAPVRLALALFREHADQRWRVIAERALDAMWEGLWDASAGGFWRYAASRDWQHPHREKLLETNAALLACYADAYTTLGRSPDRDRTAAIARFVTQVLRDPRGGYRASDADRAVYADANAAATSAVFAAAAALAETEMVRDALASFERVLLACYRPGRGVAHDDEDGVRGLLADQVAAIAALLDAHDLTGGEPYAMMAEEIGHFLAARLADAAGGGFFDRVVADGDIGLLKTRRKPFVANAEAAVVLARLQRVSREFDFAPHAAGALLAAARQARRQGPLAAHYVLAARQLR